MPKPKTPKFRSKFESRVAKMITDLHYHYEFEAETLKVPIESRGGYCSQCESGEHVSKITRYKPDFKVKRIYPVNRPVFIEAKGIFTYRDRCIAEAMAKTPPYALDWYIVFMADNKLNKHSKVRYSDWCKKHGVKYAINEVKREWLD